MVQCYECGAPCGKSHPTSWRNEHFWCDKCARKQGKKALQLFFFLFFLATSAAVTGIVACTLLRSVANAAGYGAAKGCAIGLGVSGIVLFVFMRQLATKVDGCLARMMSKLLGFLSLALGVGMLMATFLAEDALDIMGTILFKPYQDLGEGLFFDN